MPDDFYEQMDRAGILVDGGFQCCDAWQLPGQRPDLSHDFAILQLLGADDRPEPAQPPQHPELQLERQPARPGSQEAVSLQGFQQADFQEPLIASAEYKTQRRSSARRARRRARTTGCRRATGTTPRITTRATRAAPTSAAPGRSTARRAPVTPSPRSIRSTGSCRRSSRTCCGRTPTTTSTTPTTSPICPAGQRRLLVRDPPRSRRGDLQPLRRVVESEPVRAGGPGPELRDASAPSSRPTSTTRPTRTRPRRASSTGSSTRAGRRCCGISTTTTSTRPAATSAPRRPTSRCTCSTPTTTGRSSVDNLGEPRPARAVSRVQTSTASTARCSTTRPLRACRSPVRAWRATCCIPRCPPPPRRRHRQRPTSSSCCSSATARSSTATSTGSRPSRTSSTGTRRSASRRRR